MSKRSERGIVLIGFMGTGKTTVGRELARLTGLPFVDLDAEICRERGRTIPEIFAVEGEEGFREHESAALRALADRPCCVAATGGGGVTRESNWELMHRLGTIVYLRSRWPTLRSRLSVSEGRPLADGRDWSEVKTLWEARLPWYERADLVIDTDELSPAEVAAAVHAQLLAGGTDV